MNIDSKRLQHEPDEAIAQDRSLAPAEQRQLRSF